MALWNGSVVDDGLRSVVYLAVPDTCCGRDQAGSL